MKPIDAQHFNDRLEYLWKNGHIEKRCVPFIKTAVNRPLWSAWRFFFRPAFLEVKPRNIPLGLIFLGCQYRGSVLMFLSRYFPGLVVFPYFESLLNEGNENDTAAMDQIVRLFDKAVNS